MKRLCFVTSTRADWGLLMPLAKALRGMEGIELQIVATNMHLMPEMGMTVNEIEAAGFTVDCRVACAVEGDDPASRAMVMAKCMAGMSEAFTALQPDAVVLLGDRYEMLAVASAAAVMCLPIIHIAGGEISEGALDDSFRHAITKLSSLHLTATEAYRKRVIQLGEDPSTVVNTGAIGVWNAFNTPLLSNDALAKDLDIDFTEPVAVVTYHPATNDAEQSPLEQLEEMLTALDRFPALQLVITAPNNDAGGLALLNRLEDYAAKNSRRVRLVRSLGMVRYQSLLHYADVVIGNSSSGIVEAPSAGIPTVDIGIRQRGRIAAPSVIHCPSDNLAITDAIARALSPEMRELAAKKENPYYKPDTLRLMTDAVLSFLDTLPRSPKKFYDINQ